MAIDFTGLTVAQVFTLGINRLNEYRLSRSSAVATDVEACMEQLSGMAADAQTAPNGTFTLGQGVILVRGDGGSYLSSPNGNAEAAIATE